MQIDNLIDRIKLPFRKEKELFSSLYSIIGFYPHNISYYKLALMHKSVSRHFEKGHRINNERLEFLGDAVLSAVVSDIVFHHFKNKHEGFLTTTRSKIVKRHTLNQLSHDMGIDHLIKAEDYTYVHSCNVYGNAFEALVGAVYLDRGYNTCAQFIKKKVIKHLINIDKIAYEEVNFKSKLLEWGQHNKTNVEFQQTSLAKTGRDNPQFHCLVVIEGINCCEGIGFTKKESQQKASDLTLQRIHKEPQFVKEILEAKANRIKNEDTNNIAVAETTVPVE